MTDYSKIIFVNANGDFQETSAADSLKFASFKTANYELTDALLGQLVNAIVTSAGAGDAGKFVKTDGDGHIDATLINDGDIDHGSIGGLGDDDHTQYILVAGTRAFTGDQSMGGFKLTSLANGVADSDAVNFGQVKGLVNGLSHKQPVRVAVSTDVTISSPGAALDGVTLANGDRVLLAGQTDPTENGIYIFNGAASAMTRSLDMDEDSELVDGTIVSVKEGTYEGSRFMLTSDEPLTIGASNLVWEEFPFTAIVAGDGIDIVGDTVSVDVSDLAGQGLVDDGSNNLAIDFSTAYNDLKAVSAQDLSSTDNGKGASIIGLEDAGGYTSQTNVEGAIGELYGLVGNKLYTVGTGGVNKGDLVYLSANDTVTKMPINADHIALGVALTTQSAGQSVAVQRADFPLEGVLTGAIFGTRYYWDGSALTTTQPSGSGSHVYKVGVAINATDLAVDVEHIKKNA